MPASLDCRLDSLVPVADRSVSQARFVQAYCGPLLVVRRLHRASPGSSGMYWASGAAFIESRLGLCRACVIPASVSSHAALVPVPGRTHILWPSDGAFVRGSFLGLMQTASRPMLVLWGLRRACTGRDLFSARLFRTHYNIHEVQELRDWLQRVRLGIGCFMQTSELPNNAGPLCWS